MSLSYESEGINLSNYYADKLNSQKLFKVYDTSIPRVRQYLAAEIGFVRDSLKGSERVLELGAGYGRIVRELAPYCGSIVGIDISSENVGLAEEYVRACPNTKMEVMDVHKLSFDSPFDVVLCLQNGLSSMRADSRVIEDILRCTADRGAAYFSTYSSKFWEQRLLWFYEQAEKGLLGEIDTEQTKDGVIVCKDGFKARTHSEDELRSIGNELGYPYEIKEVDESSLFLIVHKN